MKHRQPDNSGLPVKTAIKQQFDAESLDSGQLQNLMTLQERVLGDIDQVKQPAQRTSRYRLLAACAVLVVAFAFLWQTSAQRQDSTRQIALEVASNHLKLKPLDVSAQSMSEVREFFTQLDFSPINSQLLATSFALPEQAMLGGRYCSIKGLTAAQLRYRRADGGISTLYEVTYNPDIYGSVPSLEDGESPREIFIKGLRISLWREKGLMMVLVEDN